MSSKTIHYTAILKMHAESMGFTIEKMASSLIYVIKSVSSDLFTLSTTPVAMQIIPNDEIRAVFTYNSAESIFSPIEVSELPQLRFHQGLVLKLDLCRGSNSSEIFVIDKLNDTAGLTSNLLIKSDEIVDMKDSLSTTEEASKGSLENYDRNEMGFEEGKDSQKATYPFENFQVEILYLKRQLENSVPKTMLLESERKFNELKKQLDEVNQRLYCAYAVNQRLTAKQKSESKSVQSVEFPLYADSLGSLEAVSAQLRETELELARTMKDLESAKFEIDNLRITLLQVSTQTIGASVLCQELDVNMQQCAGYENYVFSCNRHDETRLQLRQLEQYHDQFHQSEHQIRQSEVVSVPCSWKLPYEQLKVELDQSRLLLNERDRVIDTLEATVKMQQESYKECMANAAVEASLSQNTIYKLSQEVGMLKGKLSLSEEDHVVLEEHGALLDASKHHDVVTEPTNEVTRLKGELSQCKQDVRVLEDKLSKLTQEANEANTFATEAKSTSATLQAELKKQETFYSEQLLFCEAKLFVTESKACLLSEDVALLSNKVADGDEAIEIRDEELIRLKREIKSGLEKIVVLHPALFARKYPAGDTAEDVPGLEIIVTLFQCLKDEVGLLQEAIRERDLMKFELEGELSKCNEQLCCTREQVCTLEKELASYLDRKHGSVPVAALKTLKRTLSERENELVQMERTIHSLEAQVEYWRRVSAASLSATSEDGVLMVDQRAIQVEERAREGMRNIQEKLVENNDLTANQADDLSTFHEQLRIAERRLVDGEQRQVRAADGNNSSAVSDCTASQNFAILQARLDQKEFEIAMMLTVFEALQSRVASFLVDSKEDCRHETFPAEVIAADIQEILSRVRLSLGACSRDVSGKCETIPGCDQLAVVHCASGGTMAITERSVAVGSEPTSMSTSFGHSNMENSMNIEGVDYSHSSPNACTISFAIDSTERISALEQLLRTVAVDTKDSAIDAKANQKEVMHLRGQWETAVEQCNLSKRSVQAASECTLDEGIALRSDLLHANLENERLTSGINVLKCAVKDSERRLVIEQVIIGDRSTDHSEVKYISSSNCFPRLKLDAIEQESFTSSKGFKANLLHDSASVWEYSVTLALSQSRIEQLGMSCEEWESKWSEMRSQLTSKEIQCDNLIITLKDITRTKCDAETELSIYRERSGDAITKLSALEEELERVRSELSDKQVAIEVLESWHYEAQRQVSDLQLELAGLVLEQERSSSELLSKEAALKVLQQELEDKTVDFAESKEQIVRLSSRIAEMDSAFCLSSGELRTRVESVEQELKSKVDCYDDLQSDHDDYVRASEARVQSVEERARDWEEKYSTLCDTHRSSESEWTARVSELRGQVAELQKEVEDKRVQLVGAKDRIAELEQELRDTVARTACSISETIQTAQNELMESSKNIAQLREQLQEAQKESAEVWRCNSDLSIEMDELTSSNAALEWEYSVTLESSQSRIEQLGMRCEEFESKRNELQGQYDNLVEALDDAKKMISCMESALTESRRQSDEALVELRLEITVLDQRRLEAQRKETSLREHTENLRYLLGQAEEADEEMKEHLKCCQERLSKSEESLLRVTTDHEALHTNHTKLQHHFDEKSERLDNLEQDLIGTKSELAAIEAKCCDLTEQFTTWRDRCLDSQRNANTLRDDNNTLRELLSETDKPFKELKEQLKCCQERLSKSEVNFKRVTGDYEALHTSYTKLQIQCDEKSQLLHDLEHDLMETKSIIEKSVPKSDLVASENKCLDLSEHLKFAKAALDDTLKMMTQISCNEDELTRLRRLVQTLVPRDDLIKSEECCRQLTNSIKHLEAEGFQLKSCIFELEKELQSCIQSKNEIEIQCRDMSYSLEQSNELIAHAAYYEQELLDCRQELEDANDKLASKTANDARRLSYSAACCDQELLAYRSKISELTEMNKNLQEQIMLQSHENKDSMHFSVGLRSLKSEYKVTVPGDLTPSVRNEIEKRLRREYDDKMAAAEEKYAALQAWFHDAREHRIDLVSKLRAKEEELAVCKAQLSYRQLLR